MTARVERGFKYEGLGNDFVVLDRRSSGLDVSAAASRALCDRRRGVGADGVLVLLPSARASARMVVHNADGSLAEMCGNRFLEGLVRSTIDLTRKIIEAANVAYDHPTDEHGPIMDAVLAGNSEAAREAMKKHAVTNGESLMETERLFREKSRPSPLYHFQA